MEFDVLGCDEVEVELRGRKERERDAVIAEAFNQIALYANSLRRHPAKVLLSYIEQLCKECRETLEKPLLMDILLTTEWDCVIRNGDYEGASFRVVAKDEKSMVIMHPRGSAAALYGLGEDGNMDLDKGSLMSEKLCKCDWERAMEIFDRLPKH